MAARIGVIEWGAERARAGPWRGDHQTAYLAPAPDAPQPTTRFIGRCLDTLATQGYTTVVTAALAPSEQRPFLKAGFATHEHLHLLAHDFFELERRPTTPRVQRARRGDRREVLAVDGAAFRVFWRLDDSGLDEALRATPTARFRVGRHGAGPGETTVAYVVAGRSELEGYVQRLAVRPDHQGRGWGRALTLDALHWMRRRGARRAVVNTQLDNDPALGLYQSLGFRLQGRRLAVLKREISP